MHVPEHVAYWGALSILCAAEEAIAARQDEIDRCRLRGEPPPPEPNRHEPGLHGSVAAELEMQLAGEPGHTPCWLLHCCHLDVAQGKARAQWQSPGGKVG